MFYNLGLYADFGLCACKPLTPCAMRRFPPLPHPAYALGRGGDTARAV